MSEGDLEQLRQQSAALESRLAAFRDNLNPRLLPEPEEADLPNKGRLAGLLDLLGYFISIP